MSTTFMPCSTINGEFEKLVKRVELYAYEFLKFKSNIDNLAYSIYKESGLEDVINEMDTINDDTFGASSDLEEQLRKYSGECFQDLRKAMYRNLNNLTKFMTDTYFSLSSLYEKEIAKAYQYLKSWLGLIGMPDIISLISKTIGCLWSQPDIQNCISTLDSLYDRFDDALTTMYMDRVTGEFNEPGFFNGLTNMTETLQTNIEHIVAKLDSLESSVENRVNEALNIVSSELLPNNKLNTIITNI